MARFSQRVNFLLLALALLTAGSTSHCRAADSPTGKLVIERAVYGDLDGDKSKDVTEKIKGMVRDNSLSVAASAASLGAPAPGAAKKLKVSYTIDGIYRTKTVNDGETLDISTRLVIRKAVYGDLPKGPSADVTSDVADAVQKNSLSIKVSNETFGDPAENRVKKLRVDYSFDGVNKSKTIGENETLKISDKGE